MVVHTCHFCSYRNLMGGTPKPAKSNSIKLACLGNGIKKMAEPALPSSPVTSGKLPITESAPTPMVKTGTTLLEMKKRKRNRSTNKKPSEPEDCSNPANAEKSIGASSKRRKKSWTTLKEIADSKDQGKT